MKVCIPCSAAAENPSRLHSPYGEAPFFAFWDSRTEQLEFRKNPLADKASACACAAARWIQKQGAEVLICADIGRRAAQRLNESGIRVLHAQTGELDTLLSDYRRGRWEQTAPSGHGIPESCPSQRQGHDGRHPHSCGGGRHHGHPRRGAGQGHGYAHAQRGCHH